MKLFTLLTLLPGLAMAANLHNQITGLGPQGKVKPWICVQDKNGQMKLAIAPGQSGDANQASGNPYYVGASLRMNGCSLNDSYLGYVGFKLSSAGATNSIDTYTPPEGVHIRLGNPKLSSTGAVTGVIEYTPIAVNKSIEKAKAAKNWQFAGINLSGLEFGKMPDPSVIPNLSKEDSTSSYTDLKDMQAFMQTGMNTVRVPVSWGFLQLEGAGKGEIDPGYYNSYVKPLLQTLTKAKVHTIVDLHAYMRYSTFGEQYSGCGVSGSCPDGTLIEDEKIYQSIWLKLAKLIQNDPDIDKDYILFDLMNEPVGVSGDKVFTIQASLIRLLREHGFNGYILVEGNNWTGLHSWAKTWTDRENNTYSNATLFTKENFERAGIMDLSRILINVHQYLDHDYSGTHDECLQDIWTQGDNGFNLEAFVEYLQENQLKAIVTEFGAGQNGGSCNVPLGDFMKYLKKNSANDKNYGFVGWTLWSTGHGWGNYNLRVKPDSWHMEVIKPFL